VPPLRGENATNPNGIRDRIPHGIHDFQNSSEGDKSLLMARAGLRTFHICFRLQPPSSTAYFGRVGDARRHTRAKSRAISWFAVVVESMVGFGFLFRGLRHRVSAILLRRLEGCARPCIIVVPTGGMTCGVHELDAREGGVLRISLTYDAPAGNGKATTIVLPSCHGCWKNRNTPCLLPTAMSIKPSPLKSAADSPPLPSPTSMSTKCGCQVTAP
jgi:hypothetical protein